MNKTTKLILFCTAFFMLSGCTSKQKVFVGDPVDIDNYKRPANVLKYQWAFDTKPPSSRLDPRDFIPSNYHPNVTFIPDSRGRYIVRLTMISTEGNVLHKNFVFDAELQPDYLAAIEKPKKEEPEAKPVPPPAPKIVEVPKVVEKVILHKTTITKTPNEWLEAPKPGEKLEDIKQDPPFITEAVTEVIEESKTPVVKTAAPVVREQGIPKDAVYTLQVSSTTVEAFAIEFRDKLRARGYDAFIQTTVIDGSTRYRIRTGYYKSYEDAQRARQQMINNTEYEPWIDRIK
ncbi:MAG: SPOR domain-containing protein [FCB group bacterium]|nr:SPOR domain-containing protein [FCB group bacterium]